MKRIGMCLLLALVCSVSFAQGVIPEVDTAEVIRRGDSIEVVGEGPRASDQVAFFEALSPPADDNHRWSVTLITKKGCAACEHLKSDFHKAPELMAFVASPDESKTWAHYQELLSDDTMQQSKIKDFKFSGYPTIALQPPRNGCWGDPATIVFQQTGYDGNAKKLAKKLAEKIRKALANYSSKMKALGFPKEPVTPSPKSSVAQRGFEQSSPIDKAPDFPPYQPMEPTDRSMVTEYPPVQESQGSDLALLIAKLLASALGGSNWGVFLLITVNTLMYAWDWYRERLKAQGKVPLFTDAQKEEFLKFVRASLNQTPTPPSTPS